MLKWLRKFRLSLTLEQLQLSQEDQAQHKARSQRSREADYRLLTYLAYACNRDQDRQAALYIRKRLMEATRTTENLIQEEVQKTASLLDYLPSAMKDEPND